MNNLKHSRLLNDREDIKLGHWKHIIAALITGGFWLIPYFFMYCNYLLKRNSINKKLKEIESDRI